jgi:hypothetical protein
MRKLLCVAVLLLLSLAGFGVAAANCPACPLCSGQPAACCAPGTCTGQ